VTILKNARLALVGGAGNDTLTGAGGRDIFDYGFENAGNDTITDFTLGNTTTNTNADIINIILDSALTSSSVKFCPATQGAIHICGGHYTIIKHIYCTC
jgi:hypothetical protein